MTEQAISPLRRRMIEDMAIRKFAPKTLGASRIFPKRLILRGLCDEFPATALSRQRPGEKLLRCRDRLTMGVYLRDVEGAPAAGNVARPASVQSGQKSV